MPKRDVESKDLKGAGSGGVDGSFLDRVKDVAIHPHEPHQPPPRAAEVGDFLDSDPALQSPGWLPEGLFPELDELHAEHLARLDGLKAAGRKKSDLVAKYEAEDEARTAALYAGETVPAVTGTSDRQDALAVVEAEKVVARRQFQDFFDHAVETFKKMSPIWQLRFAEAKAERDAAVEQAKEVLRQAELGSAYYVQAEQWLHRTVKPLGGRYMEAPTFGVGVMTEAELADHRSGHRDLQEAVSTNA